MRASYFAGTWYPAETLACRAAIERHAAHDEPKQAQAPGAGAPVCGAIVPHAGWRYSGDIAARTLQKLAAACPDAEVVVVFGSHRGPDGPDTLFRADAWDGPLGPLFTDTELVRLLDAQLAARGLSLPDEPVAPARPDNGIELVLPFVRHFFPAARGVCAGLAAAPSALIFGALLGELCRAVGRRAVFVGSTDLTHYGPHYDFTPRGRGAAAARWVRDVNDRGFLDAATRRDAAALLQHGWQGRSACCPGAAAGALRAAQRFGTVDAVSIVVHTLSCDLHPDDNFVGYAGLLF